MSMCCIWKEADVRDMRLPSISDYFSGNTQALYMVSYLAHTPETLFCWTVIWAIMLCIQLLEDLQHVQDTDKVSCIKWIFTRLPVQSEPEYIGM